jgi:cytochrome oxidase Cu insertion factor (SCO1/SenC/PrrC family)
MQRLTRALLTMALLFLFAAQARAQKNVPAAPDAPAVGAKAPEFALPDTQGKTVALADLLAARQAAKGQPALLLIFYRGYW